MSNAEAEVRSRVEAILARRARRLVGVAVGVGHEGRVWTFEHGRLGPDRPHPPAPDTIFEIGSITKVFTATLLALLAERGSVALDDPANRYLPAGAQLPVRGRPITLLDLATHSSGLPRLPKGLLWTSMLHHRDDPYALFTVSDLERAVREARLKGEPGKKVRYSNFGAGLLGHVLALSAGRPYEELVRERICGPLGLSDTRIEVPDRDLGRFAGGHDRRGRPVPHWELPALAGAGALRSTVADLLRFLELQRGDGPEALRLAARATHEPRLRRGGA
jgi:CubicO group peptidase (beta-lactamase class C family)